MITNPMDPRMSHTPQQMADYFLRKFTNFPTLCAAVSDLRPSGENQVASLWKQSIAYLTEQPVGEPLFTEIERGTGLWNSLIVYKRIYTGCIAWRVLPVDESMMRNYALRSGVTLVSEAESFESPGVVDPTKAERCRVHDKPTYEDMFGDLGITTRMKIDTKFFNELLSFTETTTQDDFKGAEDIGGSISKLRDKGFNPDLLLFSPYALGREMSDQAVLESTKGEYNKQQIYGCAYAWSPNIGKDQYVITADPSALGKILMGKKLALVRETERDWKVEGAFSFVFLNQNAVNAIRVEVDFANMDAT